MNNWSNASSTFSVFFVSAVAVVPVFDVGAVLAVTPSDVVDDSEVKAETTTATPEKVAAKTETAKTADVSDAFDELFNS